MSELHKEQKVVCIAKQGGLNVGAPHLSWPASIVVGGVYTIREIDARAFATHGVVAVRLHEYSCQPCLTTVGMWELAFAAYCFRPLKPAAQKACTNRLAHAGAEE